MVYYYTGVHFAFERNSTHSQPYTTTNHLCGATAIPCSAVFQNNHVCHLLIGTTEFLIAGLATYNSIFCCLSQHVNVLKHVFPRILVAIPMSFPCNPASQSWKKTGEIFHVSLWKIIHVVFSVSSWGYPNISSILRLSIIKTIYLLRYPHDLGNHHFWDWDPELSRWEFDLFVALEVSTGPFLSLESFHFSLQS